MWFYPRVLAHRGGGTLAPENTLAALRCGLAHGFRAVEFDVMLSKDSVPVLMHDPDFGRTVSGKGKVGETSAQALSCMDAGSWFATAFAGEPVPDYRQAADFCRANRIWMNVEIKPTPGAEAETGRIVAEWTRGFFAPGDPLMPLLSSFSFEALAAAMAEAPEVPRALLVDVIPPDWRERLEALGAVALHTNHKYLLPERARAVKQAGYGLFCYTVNVPERAREILGWGVDAFCTDRIDLIGPDFAGI